MQRRNFLKLAATAIATAPLVIKEALNKRVEKPNNFWKNGYKTYKPVKKTSFAEALNKEMEGLKRDLPIDLNRQMQCCTQSMSMSSFFRKDIV